ncbi:MAG: alpha-glucoside ABC transporter substrate-binding protein [Phototrophicales bacterium]|nr:MAG: alpha-glucoside ABC transporter substrate-binding protein [Phototrophicales bacterium]
MRRKIFSALLIAVMMLASLSVVSAQDEEDDPLGIRGDDRFSWSDLEAFEGVDLGGEEVVFFGPWQTADAESLNNVIAYFNSVVTNGRVTYFGSDSFEQEIVIDIESGDPPNLAAFPQPGLAANIAAEGGLVPLGDDIRQYVLDNYAAGESWVDLATYPDENGEEQFYGVFYNVNLKSLVWYVPANFEDAGYEVPETWDEMIALSDQMVEDGFTPWCIGIGSDAATGWPATDWVEDIMLRTQPIEVYNAWVTNEIPFTDEAVVNAIEMFGSIARNPDYVSGDVATTDFREAPNGLFTVPPQCFMHRQASFIAAFFPDDVDLEAGDAAFFYFPPIDEEFGRPVLGGGTVVTITKDSPATRLFLDFLLTPLAHELWMAQAGFLTPHTGANLDTYSSSILRGQGEILVNADTFGFDGSDLMPGAIGAGAFWTAMVDYVNGASVEEITQFVQDEWDSIK